MRALPIFVAVLSSDPAFHTSLSTLLSGTGVELWLNRKAENIEDGDVEAERQLYARPVCLIVADDLDEIADRPPRLVRRLKAAEIYNPLRVILAFSARKPRIGGSWERFWPSSVSRPVVIANADMAGAMDRVKWLLALDTSVGLEGSGIVGLAEARDAFTRARALNFRGEPHNSLRLLQEISVGNPALPGLWTALGRTYLTLRQWRRSEQASERAVTLMHERTTPYYCLGASLVALQRPDEALPAFRRALSTNKQYSAAWLGEGTALADLGRVPEALESLAMALSIDRDNPWAYEDRAVFASARATRKKLLQQL